MTYETEEKAKPRMANIGDFVMKFGMASGVSASATIEPMPMVSKNAVGCTRSISLDSAMTPPTTGRTTLRRPGMLEEQCEI